MSEVPEIGETVVCKITKILDYGVFVELLEYEGVQGFVHVSQVASSWVKNIRNFVKEGQIRAAKVSHIDRMKNQIDLSFNKVSAGAQRNKIEEYKQAKRTQKLIELLAKEEKVPLEKAWAEIAEPLLEKYDSLYDAFQAIALDGEKAAEGVSKEWLNPLMELVEKNVETPKKTVKGTLTVYSNASNGVELVKKALLAGRAAAGKAEIDLVYAGSGKFQVKASAPDYKAAEKILKSISDAAIDSIKHSKGFGEFEKAS
ncbi:MAG: S1 RNA-binding domain-containing protein [Candidatus Diapherotrites archaeon]